MELSFTKMQGCANDYIYLDCRTAGVPENIAALSEKLSRRHFSIGADGIICICAPVTPGADGRMRIFNADGSEAQMCGNGVRCVAEWLYTHGVEKPVLTIDTNSGVKRITRQGARDAIKHGETALKELEAKVGFAARYRRVQEKLEELEQLVIDARFECTGPYAKLTTTEYAATLTKMLGIIRSMDEVNES